MRHRFPERVHLIETGWEKPDQTNYEATIDPGKSAHPTHEYVCLDRFNEVVTALEKAYRCIDWYAFDTHWDEGSRARAALPGIEAILHKGETK